jgi:cobalt/nickel transport system permease protein
MGERPLANKNEWSDFIEEMGWCRCNEKIGSNRAEDASHRGSTGSGVTRVLVRFSLPPVVDSPLARLDGRWRLALLLVLLIGVAAVRSLIGSLLGLGLALLTAVWSGIPWEWYRDRLAVVAGLVIVFVLPVPILAGIPWTEGIQLAGAILLRAIGLFTLACVLLTTAPVERTLQAAQALWLPGLLVQLALLSYRYLFVLADELTRLRTALRVRGFRNRGDAHSYRTVAAASGTLLVRGYERAERVAAAMRCRGFDGTFRSLGEWRTTSREVWAVLFAVMLVAGLLGLDWWLLHE